jgi:hypothetical protein
MARYYHSVIRCQYLLVMPGRVRETDGMATTDTPIVRARRKRLSEWIAQHHDGVQAAFIAATGLNQGLLSGLLGSKTFGEKIAASIEQKAGMPAGHLVSPTSPPSMPATRSDVPLDLAMARAENDLDAVTYVMGAMFTVMMRHRPAEAEEFLKRLDQFPAKFQDQGLVQTLRKVARAQKVKAKAGA